jgi:hypothetical protein
MPGGGHCGTSESCPQPPAGNGHAACKRNSDKSAIIFAFSSPSGRNSDKSAFIDGPIARNHTDFSILKAQSAIIFPETPFSRKNNCTFVFVCALGANGRTRSRPPDGNRRQRDFSLFSG